MQDVATAIRAFADRIATALESHAAHGNGVVEAALRQVAEVVREEGER
jgi:hypothetical protein